jgi:hypothetical protein
LAHEPAAVALYQVFDVRLMLDTLVLARIEIDLTQLTAVRPSNLYTMCLIVRAYWVKYIRRGCLRGA